MPRLWHMESTSLQTLSVSGNHGLSFDATVFQNVTNLRTVNMARIDHVTIPQNTSLKPLDKITYIDLSSNRLDSLNEFAINPPNPTLRTLKLNQNSITEILPNAIQGLTTDATVQMSHHFINLLTQSQWESVFVQVPDGHIDLTGNILNCGCDMDWMFLVTPEDKYLSILTDTTTCFDGTKVVFLDKMWFYYQCQQEEQRAGSGWIRSGSGEIRSRGIKSGGTGSGGIREWWGKEWRDKAGSGGKKSGGSRSGEARSGGVKQGVEGQGVEGQVMEGQGGGGGREQRDKEWRGREWRDKSGGIRSGGEGVEDKEWRRREWGVMGARDKQRARHIRIIIYG
ncbi:hypothetical protein Pcinc_001638 [Petrolisthes cinctipes]|uniref:Uncharacterized protein n=1 Tax=Petrolisthes cinctipes TaxID=88211 RepID=A0AAE1GMF4_PETCI|nr:hypothetical protein Pcinc_001638 [Petrolisthes cinctipes]